MEYTVKILLGFFIGVLNLFGLCFTLLALYSVIVIARMPRTSSIYIMAASNLTVDAVQLLLGLIYLTPSVIFNSLSRKKTTVKDLQILELGLVARQFSGSQEEEKWPSFLLPGDREGQPVIFLGSIFMFCWYYGSISQVLVAVSRLIVVCFPQYDIFTTQRVLIMVIGLYPVAVGLSITAQYILPCCNFSFNHIVLSYSYLEFSNGFNYSNAYIDLWMNSLSSGICFLCYTAILYVIRMNKVSENSLNTEERYKRRMKEYRYALQFSAISLFYFFAWTFFRIFPQYITAEDSLNWFAVISICVAINCSANALIYLFINYEVQNIIKSKIFQRGSIHMESDAQPQQSPRRNFAARGAAEATLPNLL